MESSNAVCSQAFVVDSYADGLSFGRAKPGPAQDPASAYLLGLNLENQSLNLRSRYALRGEQPLQQLEQKLAKLSRQGILQEASVYLGVCTDPFLPFTGKFDASFKFLSLFEKYQPGRLIVQTRSSLIVVALPVLKKLGKHLVITVALETCKEDMVKRYTPGLPRVQERLKLVQTLKHFGIEVRIQVAPLLPYGDWQGEAAQFAALLCEHADFINVQPIYVFLQGKKTSASKNQVGAKLAADRQFYWLRPDSANPLITAIERLAPHKLKIPAQQPGSRQLKLFAA